MAVVSVDLAYRDYRDFGMAVLDDRASGATYELLTFAEGSAQTPTPEHVADIIIDVCKMANASLILLDGPQGWKDPSNGLAHSRLCERILNTPGKTGLPGNVKPATYRRNIEFFIQVFDVFQARGWGRFDPARWRPGYLAVIESFFKAAWLSLGLPYLPAKKKARDRDIRRHLEYLVSAGLIAGDGPTPTHDQLQALVAGLGGLGVSANTAHRYQAVGVPPFILDGTWREGYIVNPASVSNIELQTGVIGLILITRLALSTDKPRLVL
jgi:hypothetical protein